MSSSSEETHDDDEQGPTASLVGRQEQQATPRDRLTPSQESTGIGSKLSSAVTSQKADGFPKNRKRSLDEYKATDPPEEEQHSSQSAFQQCHPHSQQNSIQQPQALPLASQPQALHLLLSAAQSKEGISCLNQPHEGASLPMSADQHFQHMLKPVPSRTEQPSFFGKSSSLRNAWLSRARSAQLQLQQTSKKALSHVDIMYAPIRSASKISAQLIWDIQRLEQPEMDADSVQAALEFADAVRIKPAQHAQQPGFPSQNPAEQVTLLHTVEVGTGRLDVLRVLTHRIRSSSLTELSYGINGPGQLLDVIQDLLKDMDASQQLLYHAEQTVLAYQQAALARVESLQAHRTAAQDYWLQTQRLQAVTAQRRSVLQKMMMLPEDCPGRELLELYEKLREAVVHALEVSACRVRLSSDMQSAQARLLAQGVSGVTTTGMINGTVELAVNRPVLRLQTLMRILRGIDSTKGVLLDELASALAQGPWHQRPQHMHDDSYKLVEAVSQVQARIMGLLQQGQRAGGPGQEGLAPIQTPLAGTPVACHTSFKVAKVRDDQSPHDNRRRSVESALGGQSPDEASPHSALPLHVSRGKSGLLSRESKSGPSGRNAREASADASPLLQALAQAQLQNEVKEHILIRPKAQRPQSGVSHYESGRDPRAHHMAAKQARSVTPQPEQDALPALLRASTEQPKGRTAPDVPSDSARAKSPANLGTAQSPEVLAAAQALLQSQLQQLAVKPEEIPPQLMGLFHALCANSSTGNVLQAPTHASAPDHEPNSPFQRANSHTHRLALEGLNHDKIISESRFQAGKTPRLSRTDSGRGVREKRRAHEGLPPSRSAPEQAVELSQVPPVKTVADSAKLYSTALEQRSPQTEATVYAQHLYGLLAAQAQAVGGAVGGSTGIQGYSNGLNVANKQVPKHSFARQ